MTKESIQKIARFKRKKNEIKRYLDIEYFNKDKKSMLFDELEKCDNEIKKEKFKLNLEREMRENDESRKEI